MNDDKNPDPQTAESPTQRPPTSPDSDMLTPSEIEALRQEMKASAKKMKEMLRRKREGQ